MTQTIAVHSAAAVEYTWPTVITELSGENITADAVVMCLGSFTTPGTFVAPDVKTTGTTTVGEFVADGCACGCATIDLPDSTVLYQVTVKLLIGASLSPAAGNYWVWTKLTDTPESVPRVGAKITIT